MTESGRRPAADLPRFPHHVGILNVPLAGAAVFSGHESPGVDSGNLVKEAVIGIRGARVPPPDQRSIFICDKLAPGRKAAVVKGEGKIAADFLLDAADPRMRPERADGTVRPNDGVRHQATDVAATSGTNLT
jgi:hypothetical protein